MRIVINILSNDEGKILGLVRFDYVSDILEGYALYMRMKHYSLGPS